MSKIISVEGIVIKTVPYRDHDLILSIFSNEEGVVKLIANGYANPKKGKGSSPAPLIRAEFVYVESQNELKRCREISFLDTYRRLRTTLPYIEAACHMLKALGISQLPGKPAPVLYALLISYLDKIPDFPSPHILAASFLLKILRHDGLVDFENGVHPLWQRLALSRSFAELAATPYPQKIWDGVYSYFCQQIESSTL